MRFSAIKKAMQLVLFMLLAACLALVVTNGQASAATYQASETANVNQAQDGVAGCANWSDANGGECYDWAVTIPSTPYGCADWDAQDQVCTAWTGASNIEYPTVSIYIYGLRYQCTDWNSHRHACTHWKRGNNDFSRRSVHIHNYGKDYEN
jgi:hypothetical protein